MFGSGIVRRQPGVELVARRVHAVDELVRRARVGRIFREDVDRRRIRLHALHLHGPAQFVKGFDTVQANVVRVAPGA